MTKRDLILRSMRIYIQEYKKLVDKYPKYKDSFPKYYEDGINIIYYLSDMGIKLFYLLDKKDVKITVVKIKPNIIDGENIFIEKVPITRFNRLLEDPIYYARIEVSDYISFLIHEEDMAKNYESEIEQYYKDISTFGIERMTKYFKEANQVYEKTISIHQDELFFLHRLLFSQNIIERCFLASPHLTLSEIFSIVSRDIESSYFLALYGKYIPANALLRRWLETVFVASYIDRKINTKLGEKTKEYWKNKGEKWLEGKNISLRFRGEYSVVSELINPDVEVLLGSIAPKTDPSNNSSLHWKKYVEDTYSNLSKYVHYGGMRDERWLFTFSEYSEVKFKQWFSNMKMVNEICNLVLVFTFHDLLDKFKKESSDYEEIEYAPLLSYDQRNKYEDYLKSKKT